MTKEEKAEFLAELLEVWESKAQDMSLGKLIDRSLNNLVFESRTDLFQLSNWDLLRRVAVYTCRVQTRTNDHLKCGMCRNEIGDGKPRWFVADTEWLKDRPNEAYQARKYGNILVAVFCNTCGEEGIEPELRMR